MTGERRWGWVGGFGGYLRVYPASFADDAQAALRPSRPTTHLHHQPSPPTATHPLPAAARSLPRQPIPLHLLPQSLAADAEARGGGGHAEAVGGEGALDGGALAGLGLGTATGSLPPMRVRLRVCTTRSRRVWNASGMSPISSRKSTPSPACSNAPGRRRSAPVKAPRSWLKSSA